MTNSERTNQSSCCNVDVIYALRRPTCSRCGNLLDLAPELKSISKPQLTEESDLLKNWQQEIQDSNFFKNSHSKFMMTLMVGQIIKDLEAYKDLEAEQKVEEALGKYCPACYEKERAEPAKWEERFDENCITAFRSYKDSDEWSREYLSDFQEYKKKAKRFIKNLLKKAIEEAIRKERERCAKLLHHFDDFGKGSVVDGQRILKILRKKILEPPKD